MNRAQAFIELKPEQGITSMAQYYTSAINYDPDRFDLYSADMEALLWERGFLG